MLCVQRINLRHTYHAMWDISDHTDEWGPNFSLIYHECQTTVNLMSYMFINKKRVETLLLSLRHQLLLPFMFYNP